MSDRYRMTVYDMIPPELVEKHQFSPVHLEDGTYTLQALLNRNELMSASASLAEQQVSWTTESVLAEPQVFVFDLSNAPEKDKAAVTSLIEMLFSTSEGDPRIARRLNGAEHSEDPYVVYYATEGSL